MIKSLFKLALIAVVGILLYNYFLGTPTEKENAKQIFGKVKEVGVAVKDLVQAEKEKFDEGKYDAALDKIGGLFQDLKQKAKDIDENYVDRIAALDEKRKELEERLKNLDVDRPKQYDEFTEKSGESEESKIRNEIEELMKETEKIVEEMERK
jgi:basic membrane lipoprotein Med (substrate-binding protein (PBP1-ABC) superfamily)